VKAVDTRHNFFDVWNVYWPIALAVLVIVAGLALLFLFRNRARDGDDERPGGRDEHTPLEVGYAVGLACVAAFLVALTFSRMPGDADSAASEPPVAIEVTASRWNWRFEYPGGAVEQGTKNHVPVLRVPVGRPIAFRGTSLDVIHSFWVPEARFKRDLFPGMRTRWEMVFDRVANWPGGGECAEFCGLEHARMVFDVLVMPRGEFEAWLGTVRSAARTAARSAA